jgi:hypothetical protein
MDEFTERILRQKVDEGVIPSFHAFRQSRRIAHGAITRGIYAV